MSTLLFISGSLGCSKVDELMGKKEDSAQKTDDAKAEGGDEKAEAGEQADGPEAEVAEVEPIPVEELHVGLDLMLKVVPDEHQTYVIVRDATVLTDYVDEGVRFVDGPLAKLASSPMGSSSPELMMASAGLAAVKPQMEQITAAVEASGVNLKEGVAFIKQKGGSDIIVFNAADPNALKGLVTAVAALQGETPPADMHCKPVDGLEGFNACADTQAALDQYKPREDPADLKGKLTETLGGGITLDDTNIVAHIKDKEEIYLAVSTIPGTLHVAVSVDSTGAEMQELKDALTPGEGKALSHVAPGAGFIWANVNATAMQKLLTQMAGAPPPVEDFVKALNGEVLFAGSIDPGGFVLTAGMTDTTKWEPIHALATSTKDLIVEQVNKDMGENLKGAKFVFDEVPLTGGSASASSLHVALTDLPEADVLRSLTGLHLDGWAFAANDGLTLAVGPSKDSVGKLLEAGSGGGPSDALLASLPGALAEGLRAKEVSAVMHMPVDFLHGKQMHDIIKTALKDVAEAKPDDVLAATSLLAPLSSGTMWIAQPAGKPPVFHLAVRGVGNRETEEGKAALDAAHTVADGGDPEAAFSGLATKFAASPMAYAYKARAGTDGPAYLVGSGLGAIVAAGAMAVPIVLNERNEQLAEDLGVKPEDPEPELKPTAVPAEPVTKKVEKKPPAPKKPTPKKDPKADEPKGDDPKADDPKADDPVVEPKRPLPPKPTTDPGTGERRRVGGRKPKAE